MADPQKRPDAAMMLPIALPKVALGGTVDDAVALPRDYEIFTGAFECSVLIFIALRF